MSDIEVDTIVKINEVLSQIPDEPTKQRILRWACEKFGGSISTVKTPTAPLSPTMPRVLAQVPAAAGNEIPGIAKIFADGSFKLTVRDPKAKSTADAAIRLALVAARAYQLLSGADTVSSKNIIVPTLRDWRAYDGNTRQDLADHKGIVRNGDNLSLDVHATQEADGYIKEIGDESIVGTWKPGQRGRGKAPKPAAAPVVSNP